MIFLKEFRSINYRKHFIRAILFLLFLLHSYFILRYYLKYEKLEERRSELHWPLELPDVTVCNNDVISEDVDGTKSIWLKKNEMEYIRVLSFAKKLNFSKETFTNVIKHCEFTDYNVPCKKYQHFNYFYGDCETISVGERPNSDIPVTGIKFDGNVFAKYAYQFRRQPSFVMVIHKPETPAIFLRKNLIFGDYYGDYVIHLKKKIMNRIDCFDEEDAMSRPIAGFINATKYSYDACLASCYQHFAMEQCACVLPQFHFAENNYRYPVCIMCRGEFTFDLSQLCDCKPLCDDSEWEWSVEDVRLINQSEPMRYLVKAPNLYNQMDTNGATTPKDPDDYEFKINLKRENAIVTKKSSVGYYFSDANQRYIEGPSTFMVKVQYETAEVTILNEKLLMERAAVIRTIGGSICLFFGTNALRGLQLLLLEMFAFFSETKRKLILLNRSKICLNVRRVAVVLKQLLWLIATLALSLLSGFLTKDLIDDYLNFPTLQHPSVNWNQNFPAVTVCSAVPLLWDAILYPRIWIENSVQEVRPSSEKNANQSDFIRHIVREMTAIKTDLEKKSAFAVYLEGTDYYDKLLRKFQTGSREERVKYGIKMDDYIKSCTWSYSGLTYNCSETQFVQFNNHKYGNCATFNHGSLAIEDNNGPIDEVEIVLSWNQLPLPVLKNLTGAPGLIVRVHERGTAPLFSPSTTHLIRGFSFNHITFTAEKHLLSSRNCALHGQHAHMTDNSAYGDETRQYKHTSKSCLESCFQKLTHEEIRCRSCYQPLMLGKYDVKEENTCTTFCPWIDEGYFINKCGCQQQCDLIEYKTRISTSNFVKKLENSSKILDQRQNPDYLGMSKFPQLGAVYQPRLLFSNRTIYPNGNCGFKVSARKNIENVFYQTPKIKLWNVLGLFGGIMGFLQALLSIFRSLRIFIVKSP